MGQRTVFFLPIYNQVAELPQVLDEIDKARLWKVDFLLINNGSSDGSEELIRGSRHHRLEIDQNLGVGYSYIRAIEWALEQGYDFLGTMAANGKMIPSEIPRLLDPLQSGNAMYVSGSRFLSGTRSPNLPRFRRAAIPTVNSFAWAMTGKRLTDATNGFRAFRLSIMERATFDWHAEWLRTYAFEYYLYAKVLMDRELTTLEVATTMRYPAEGRYSKIKPGRDWFAMLWPWVRARFDGHGFESVSPPTP